MGVAAAIGTMLVLAGVATRPAQAQTYTVLYNFTGGADGAHPAAGVIPDGSGNLSGTTSQGGNLSDCFGLGCGVVFRLTPH